jgi:hypothetical protein
MSELRELLQKSWNCELDVPDTTGLLIMIDAAEETEEECDFPKCNNPAIEGGLCHGHTRGSVNTHTFKDAKLDCTEPSSPWARLNRSQL